mmetsp:Transcript_39/g.53  ORF Transcript_39/g.53 Transcript_39/m.53 type:complete len:144 (-) Transcript_39:170-601(-)
MLSSSSRFSKSLISCRSRMAYRRFGSDTSPLKKFRVYFPIVGVFLGCTALSFQVFVLYPWHEILTENFEALEAITKKLEVTQAILHKKVDAVILLQADLNTRETKVLDLQNLIHHRIDNMESLKTLMNTEEKVVYKDNPGNSA